jgi:hypothetical protein
MKTWGRTVACWALLVATGCASSEPDRSAGTQSATLGTGSQVVTGTIRHLDLESGFYGIEADDGTKYDPVNLPQDFRQDGLRVEVRVEELKDRVSIHMWGKVVRIVQIKRLPPAGGY